ncbi:MAG: ATP-binding protein [Gammaproteobacteria bacterium]|nr:ATP-binding protein [Gammaproteobacteria bacterium]
MVAVVAEMVRPTSLEPEWKRIELLAQCLLEARYGREPAEALLSRLNEVQHQVECLREEGQVWRSLSAEALPALALDLLAAVYAPAVNPNVALLYQDLQQSNSVYPSLAFLHRLLAFNEQEYALVQQLVQEQGELLGRGLLLGEGEGPLRQLKPHPALLPSVTGLPAQRLRVPGAVPIDIPADWQDLIIQPAQQRMLQEYLLWIQHADRLVNEWGGRPPGGPIALFSGPSGTGKTFAASVIANQLGWDLYRVDLGALVSKYIGETEKNLNALFDAVHGREVLLQFDEVDALMGKRGEVKDARDRYANMEVSHLLSRIEQHQGPCILTTNLRKQIDQAFQRRFHFVVTFPRPEAPERQALWQRLLPAGAPKAVDLDLSLVAEAVALTGGEIRNAANHAAILAAAGEVPIGMQQVATGVWRVLQKTDGQTRLSQLRQLAGFLPREIVQGETP